VSCRVSSQPKLAGSFVGLIYIGGHGERGAYSLRQTKPEWVCERARHPACGGAGRLAPERCCVLRWRWCHPTCVPC